MNPTTLGYCYMLINPEECGYHLILSKSQVLNHILWCLLNLDFYFFLGRSTIEPSNAK